ncbi:MAG: T9SS type B sorting domain-containing protein [Nonlabens sp.]|uniref:T9SS type B sorting domain-containing protein n=1 Tax=Nonlabens sp. TaxID=1888209 RepID=UPI00321C3456
MNLKRIIVLFSFLSIGFQLSAQLGFCQGNSGDPIFTETFGTGTNFGPALPGTTIPGYSFVGNSGPQDGQYTIASNTSSYGWNLPSDHTVGDVNGKALIVNGSFSPGDFYVRPISGLCQNTTYEFSAWLINILPSTPSACGGNGVPINVQFEIWDDTDTILLASGNTGNIFSSNTPTWDQYALVFQTLPAQTSVILRMLNNSAGGCGNDLAIDDIEFKTCGDLIAVEDASNSPNGTICDSNTPFTLNLNAIPDNAVFSNHFYQWQDSTDGIIWNDIPGAINQNVTITNIISTSFYRTKVAEFAANLSNLDCLTYSDVYQLTVNNLPTQPVIQCWETATINDATCSWDVTGSQPLQPTIECWQTATFNTTSCSWDIVGTQPLQPTTECWQTATFNTTSCIWDVTGVQPVQPTAECWETATFDTVTCSWNISGTQPVQPTTECWETATFNTTTCIWDVTGNQPSQPTIECWETATFDAVTCSWNISGTQPVQPTTECWETATFNTVTCSWEVAGTQPAQPNLECWETTTFNNATCVWDITGSQPVMPTSLDCWQTATFNNTTCTWEVTGTQPVMPTLECWQTTAFNTTTCVWDLFGTQNVDSRTEDLLLCENDSVTLDPNTSITNATFQWNSGEQTPTLDIDLTGTYTVEITDGCVVEIVNYIITREDRPVIASVVSDYNSIVISIANAGIYQFSLDGFTYQNSPVFRNQPVGLYTIYVRTEFCEYELIVDYIHFYVPRFFTPNQDGFNDFFTIDGLELFTSSNLNIFDRYGKLLKSYTNSDIAWDGTFNGSPLPSSDYWYVLTLDGKEYRGHFALKR